MQTKPEKTLSTFLRDNSGLNKILQKVNQLQHLDQLLKTFLEPDISAHCQVANFRENILVIQCDNAAWATRIKFLIPQLISFLRQPNYLPQLASISVIIKM